MSREYFSPLHFLDPERPLITCRQIFLDENPGRVFSGIPFSVTLTPVYEYRNGTDNNT